MILGLSKTKYCKGVQCPKMLWMEKYKPEEAEDILPESILATGTMVGDLARGYFGEHVLVEFNYDKTVMAAKTKQFMEAGAETIRQTGNALSQISSQMGESIDEIGGQVDQFNV